jgi:hypothetical protein
LKENRGYRNEGRVACQGLWEQWPLLLTVKQAEVACSLTNKIDKLRCVRKQSEPKTKYFRVMKYSRGNVADGWFRVPLPPCRQ